MYKEFYVVDAFGNGASGINIYIEADEYYADFSFRWYDIGGNITSPKLEIFDDCWYVLFNHCQDLLAKMSKLNKKNTSIQEFANMLESLGYARK